jgi:hypothetical protein
MSAKEHNFCVALELCDATLMFRIVEQSVFSSPYTDLARIP